MNSLSVFYIFVSFCTILFLFFVLYIVMHSKSRFRWQLCYSITAEIFSVAFYASLMLVKTDFSAFIFYSLFFACKTWFCFYSLKFCLDYTEIHFYRKLFDRIFAFLAIADSVCFFINPFFKNSFEVSWNLISGGFYFWEIHKNPSFYLHFALCGFYSLLAVAVLIFKIIKSPKIYKQKYFAVLFVCAFVIACEVVSYCFSSTFALSVLIYAFLTFLIYCFTNYLVPNKITESSVENFYKTDSDFVLFFNSRGRCIFANDEAKKLFCASGKYLQSYANSFRSNFIEKYGNAEKIVLKNELLDINGKPLSCSVIYEEICMSDKNLGSCFIIKNRTEEMNILFREHYIATHDSLTGLYNREYFFEKVNERLKNDRTSKYLMLASNIKNFKFVNELFGAKRGDQILCKQAEFMRSFSHKGNIYARILNDKFAMLIREEDFVSRLFEEHIRSFNNIIVTSFYKLKIYIGVAKVTDVFDSASVLYDKAALAIDSISEDFQQSLVYYNKTIMNQIVEEKNIISEFEQSIVENKFLIYMQPILSKEQKCYGAQSLVRWQTKKNALLLPEYFESTLKKTGLIYKLDLYVWEKVIIKIKEWEIYNILPENFFVFIKVSSKDFYYINVAQEIISLVEKYGINPYRLVVEISADTFFTDFDKVQNDVQQLHQNGIRVSIDNFGKGISSLNFVNSVKADFIKINMDLFSGTEGVGDIKRGKPVVDFIVRLSKILGISTVAKNLESDEQMDYLDSIGCKYFQYDDFCVPIPSAQFVQRFLLKKSKAETLN